MGERTPRGPDFLFHVLPPSAPHLDLWGSVQYISTKGAILGFARDVILEGFPSPRRGPQIVLWTEERVPELALAHIHTDEYFAYHHRTFIWR